MMGTTDSDNDELREVYGPAEDHPQASEPEPAPAEPEPEPEPEPEGEVAAPAVEPDPEPEPIAESPVDPGPATEPVVVWESHGERSAEPLAPIDEPPAPPRRPARDALVRVGLGVALIALFFAPWFDVDPALRASGAGMVRWTARFLDDLPSRRFDVGMLMPFLAVLIPIGALVVIVAALLRRDARLIALLTGLIAPLLLVYGLLRDGAGADLFKVLDAGAYLTLACSLALIATALGLLASRWGRVTLALGTAALIIAAFAIPIAAQDDVDSPVFAAYASDRTELGRSGGVTEAAQEAADDAADVTIPTTTLLQTASTEVSPTTTTTTASASATTVVTTRVTTVVAATPTTSCPTRGPSSAVTSFHYDETGPGTNNYLVDVRGIVDNPSSATMDVSSIEIDILRGSTVVGHISAQAGRAVGPGQRLEWFQDNVPISSPDSPPTQAVITSVPYTWHDPALSGCPRP